MRKLIVYKKDGEWHVDSFGQQIDIDKALATVKGEEGVTRIIVALITEHYLQEWVNKHDPSQ